MVVLAFAGLLIWWGAAVTTKDVGLAVPDWPLSFGQVNPEGWLGKEALFLEHGHRSIASFVGTLTAILFLWIWLKSTSNRGRVLAEFGVLTICLAAIVVGVSRGYTLKSANSQAAAGNTHLVTGDPTPWFAMASIVGLLCIGWFCWSWARRGWSLPLKLSGLALLFVELQAVLGGLRVTEMSDTFGVVHGCFGQVFFCLLFLVVLVTSRSWQSRPLVSSEAIKGLRIWGGVLFGSIFGQLILGATMRHTHRIGLAADDIVTTGGSFLPDFSNFDLVILFSHKSGAVVVFLVVLAFAAFALRHLTNVPAILRSALLLVGLVCVQLCLGIFVLETGKSFWVTNFHVITGLGILSSAFYVLVQSWRAISRSALLVQEESESPKLNHTLQQDSAAHHV
ncbi:MAG: heme A synthase [Verrucomicrobiales bacterium]|jgi:heme A synthase